MANPRKARALRRTERRYKLWNAVGNDVFLATCLRSGPEWSMKARSTLEFKTVEKLSRHLAKLPTINRKPDQMFRDLGDWIQRQVRFVRALKDTPFDMEHEHSLLNVLPNMGNYVATSEKNGGHYLCKCCGKPSNFGQYSDRPCEKGLCFDCNFWIDRLLACKGEAPSVEDNKVRMVYLNNGLYEYVGFVPGFHAGPSHFLGCGGAQQRFQLADGCVWSNNVWCGGAVPLRFAHMAQFLEGKAIVARPPVEMLWNSL